MSRYLLDTKLMLWWLQGDARLPSWEIARLQAPGFDRLLVTLARQEPLTLVSGDPVMERYGATVFPLHS